MILRKCGAHFARIRRPSARPTGVDHGSSNAEGSGVAGGRPRRRCTKLGGPAPTPCALASHVSILSYAAASMSVRSRPRPVRTRKKKFSTFAPSSFARSTMAGTSSTFQSVTDMCSEKSRSASLSTRVARTACSHAFGRCRNASCFFGSVESRLMEAPSTPRSRISLASRSRRRTPLVPNTVVKRFSAA